MSEEDYEGINCLISLIQFDRTLIGSKKTQTVRFDSEEILDGWNCIEQVEYEKKISSSKLLNETAEEDPVILRQVPFFSCKLFDSVVAEVNIITFWRVEKSLFEWRGGGVVVVVVDIVVEGVVIKVFEFWLLITHCKSSNRLECKGGINWIGKLINLPWK